MPTTDHDHKCAVCGRIESHANDPCLWPVVRYLCLDCACREMDDEIDAMPKLSVHLTDTDGTVVDSFEVAYDDGDSVTAVAIKIKAELEYKFNVV